MVADKPPRPRPNLTMEKVDPPDRELLKPLDLNQNQNHKYFFPAILNNHIDDIVFPFSYYTLVF